MMLRISSSVSACHLPSTRRAGRLWPLSPTGSATKHAINQGEVVTSRRPKERCPKRRRLKISTPDRGDRSRHIELPRSEGRALVVQHGDLRLPLPLHSPLTHGLHMVEFPCSTSLQV